MKRFALWLVVMGLLLTAGLAFGQCLAPTELTAYRALGNANISLRFVAPAPGIYRVWSTTDASLAGAYPQNWTILDEVYFPAGNCQWTDPHAITAYRRYTVTHFCVPLESSPCNEVGYAKIQCNGSPNSSLYTAFGLPFRFWNVEDAAAPVYGSETRKPSCIVGTQTNCGTSSTGDRIVRQDIGQFAYRSSPTCNWAGSLEVNSANMEAGRAYWYRNASGATRNLVLTGDAELTCAGIPGVVIAAPSSPGLTNTAYSWRCPRAIPIARLNLLEQGFAGGTATLSDKIMAQQGGASGVYLSDSQTWYGTLTEVYPGRAYWIQNKHVNHLWRYTYDCSGRP